MILSIFIGLILLYGLYLYKTREVILDADDLPYLVRYFLKRLSRGRYCLHNIRRSDHDRSLHDHPWPFKSLILWGGYYEVVDNRVIPADQEHLWKSFKEGQSIRWFGPLSYLKRPAYWSHRLILKEGRWAWTFVFMGKKEREWGFWMAPDKFCHNMNYDTKTGLCNVDT